MEAIYPYAHIIHLILAIMFLGYVFTDLTIISAIKAKISKQDEDKVNQELGKRSFKIFPLTLLFLILTGGMMMSKYINSSAGFFETDLQKILMFKIALALIIALGVLSNIYTKVAKKKKNEFMQNHFHKVVLALGLLIVISAQWMFLA